MSTTNPLNTREYLDENQVSKLLNISPKTLRNWRVQGEGPKFVKLSNRLIRYRRVDIDTWADSHVRSSTSDRGILRNLMK